MKLLSLLALFLVTLTTHAQTNHTSLSSFDWLLGTWENLRVKPGETTTESWTKQGDMLFGTGVTMRGTDTVFIEKLKIVKKDGHYYYVAEVSHNAAPVYFKITEVSEHAFTSENPEHDFPKKIAYQYDGEVLTATISAGEKAIPFRFRKR